MAEDSLPEDALEDVVESEDYWVLKGYGRIILVVGLLFLFIAVVVYGFGLLLLRIHEEKKESEGVGDYA